MIPKGGMKAYHMGHATRDRLDHLSLIIIPTPRQSVCQTNQEHFFIMNIQLQRDSVSKDGATTG